MVLAAVITLFSLAQPAVPAEDVIVHNSFPVTGTFVYASTGQTVGSNIQVGCYYGVEGMQLAIFFSGGGEIVVPAAGYPAPAFMSSLVARHHETNVFCYSDWELFLWNGNNWFKYPARCWADYLDYCCSSAMVPLPYDSVDIDDGRIRVTSSNPEHFLTFTTGVPDFHYVENVGGISYDSERKFLVFNTRKTLDGSATECGANPDLLGGMPPFLAPTYGTFQGTFVKVTYDDPMFGSPLLSFESYECGNISMNLASFSTALSTLYVSGRYTFVYDGGWSITSALDGAKNSICPLGRWWGYRGCMDAHFDALYPLSEPPDGTSRLYTLKVFCLPVAWWRRFCAHDLGNNELVTSGWLYYSTYGDGGWCYTQPELGDYFDFDGFQFTGVRLPPVSPRDFQPSGDSIVEVLKSLDEECAGLMRKMADSVNDLGDSQLGSVGEDTASIAADAGEIRDAVDDLKENSDAIKEDVSNISDDTGVIANTLTALAGHAGAIEYNTQGTQQSIDGLRGDVNSGTGQLHSDLEDVKDGLEAIAGQQGDEELPDWVGGEEMGAGEDEVDFETALDDAFRGWDFFDRIFTPLTTDLDPDSQSDYVMHLALPMPDGGTFTYDLGLLPDTSTPMGRAADDVRKGFRGISFVIVYLIFILKVSKRFRDFT